MNESDPFVLWRDALKLDRTSRLKESKEKFEEAAAGFFEQSKLNPPVSRAMFEYSTIMDAFSVIQQARMLRDLSQYEESLSQFGKAADILRATLHFGFLASYVAACATLETTSSMDYNEDSLEALKSANALLEQGKLALSFRDERHPLMPIINAMIKFSISKSLLVESRILLRSIDSASSEQRFKQSLAVLREYQLLAADSRITEGVIDYFIPDDWERAKSGAFICCYPDPEKLWLMNLGTHIALVQKFGSELLQSEILPTDSLAISLQGMKGKIRVVYRDRVSGAEFDEGCMMLI